MQSTYLGCTTTAENRAEPCAQGNCLLKKHISQVKNNYNCVDVSLKPIWKNAFYHIKNIRENRLSLLYFFKKFCAKPFAFKMSLILLIIVPFLISFNFSLFNVFDPAESHVDANKSEEQEMTSNHRKIKLRSLRLFFSFRTNRRQFESQKTLVQLEMFINISSFSPFPLEFTIPRKIFPQGGFQNMAGANRRMNEQLLCGATEQMSG